MTTHATDGPHAQEEVASSRRPETTEPPANAATDEPETFPGRRDENPTNPWNDLLAAHFHTPDEPTSEDGAQ